MDLPLGWQGFPSSHWVQRRVPGARTLVLRLNRNFDPAELDGEVSAHIVSVLSHAQPSRLHKLVYSPGAHRPFKGDLKGDRIAPNASVLKAIGRFTALTVLHLRNLCLYEGSFQVDTTDHLPALSTTTQRVNA